MACLPAVHRICHTATSQAMAQAKPSQSQAKANLYGLA
jgi:hypothetical protein